MGKTWQRISDSDVNAYYSVLDGRPFLGHHPADSRYAYRIWSPGNKLPKHDQQLLQMSQDGGKSWKTAEKKIKSTQETIVYGQFLALHPTDPKTIYEYAALLGSEEVPRMLGLYVSHDSGSTFSLLMTSADNAIRFAISKNNPNVMYCSAFNGFVSKTENSGKFWTLVGPFSNNIEDSANKAIPDNINRRYVSAINIHPRNDRIVFVLTDNGIWKTTNSAATWKFLKPSTHANLWMRSMVLLTDNKEEVLLVSTNKGLFKSQDEGNTWSEIPLP